MGINLSVSTMLNQLNSTGSYSYKTSKKTRIVDEDKYNAKETSVSLNTSIRNLRKVDLSTVGGKTKAKKHIKNILSSFNDLKNNSASSSKAAKRTMTKLSALFDEYSDELEDLGITKSANGKKYSFDNAKWEKLDEDKMTEAFDKLFRSDCDFSKKLEKYTKSIKSIMSENQIQTKEITSNNSVTIDNNKIAMAGSSNNLIKYISSFTTANSSDAATTYMNGIINNFNNIFTTEQTTNTSSTFLNMLSDLIKSNKTALNSVGLDCNQEGTSISFYNDDNTTFKGNYSDAIDLFSGRFGSDLSSATKELFCDLLETQRNNITVNGYI